jgi:formylglycine-generating enzyme required for sulfatase activity
MGTPEAALQERLRGVTGDQARFLRSEVQREAVVAEPFYLSATEVTVGLFRRFVESSRPRHVPRSEQDGGWGWHPQQGWRFAREFSWHNPGQLILTDDHPVANVDWDDAEAFCRWLTKQTESVCRLPTEVEWEFACRAGSAGLWCFGDDVDDLPLYAWTADDSGDVPQPVAGKRPNAFGLFDMHGNQLEWCRLATGDQLPVDERPVRGGRFRANPDHTRSGARRWHRRFDLVPGFRVLQVVPARS